MRHYLYSKFKNKGCFLSKHNALNKRGVAALFKRVIAGIMVCVVALFTDVPPPVYAQSSGLPFANLNLLFQDLNAVAVPEQIGEIQEFHIGNRDKMVVLIQDAHSIPDAQLSIQRLINFFQKKYGISIVSLEGSSKEYDAQIFKSFPDQDILKQVFKTYLNDGELTGGTAASLFNQSQGVYHGIENWSLYEEGIGHFLRALRDEPEVRTYLSEYIETLDEGKRLHYSKDLIHVDRILKAFNSNSTNFVDALRELSVYLAPPQESELALLLDKSESPVLGAEIDIEIRKVAQAVKAHLIAQPVNRGVAEDLSEYNRKMQQYQISALAPEDFALYLRGLIAKYKILIRISKRLKQLVTKQKKMRDIRGTALFRSFEDYTQEVKNSLFSAPIQRQLDQQSRVLELLERLIALELTQNDWSRLKTLRNELEYWDISRDGIIAKSDILNLLRRAGAHLAFYQNAELRDVEFQKQITYLMNRHKSQASIVVAGGFHTEGLTRQLKEKGISYLLLMPQINELPDEIAYREHMQGNVSWKDYFEIENGRVSLYKAFVRAVRDRLIAASPDDAKVILKRWRDQIIRDVAKQNRVAEAGQYTQFIDEVLFDTDNSDIKNLASDWFANIDFFQKTIERLQKSGNLTNQSVLQLLQTFNSQPLALSPFGQAWTTPENLGGLIVRSEQRSDGMTWSQLPDDWKAFGRLFHQTRSFLREYVNDLRALSQKAQANTSSQSGAADLLDLIETAENRRDESEKAYVEAHKQSDYNRAREIAIQQARDFFETYSTARELIDSLDPQEFDGASTLETHTAMLKMLTPIALDEIINILSLQPAELLSATGLSQERIEALLEKSIVTPQEEVDLGKMLRDTASVFYREARIKSDSVEIDLQAVDDVKVVIAKGQFVGAINNLLRNAGEEMFAKSVGNKITMSLAQEGDQAVLRIRDDGPGIDASINLDDLFKADVVTSTKLADGLEHSIGLPSVKETMESFGGSISVTTDQSAENHGTEFIIRLPIVVKSELRSSEERRETNLSASAQAAVDILTDTAETGFLFYGSMDREEKSKEKTLQAINPFGVGDGIHYKRNIQNPNLIKRGVVLNPNDITLSKRLSEKTGSVLEAHFAPRLKWNGKEEDTVILHLTMHGIIDYSGRSVSTGFHFVMSAQRYRQISAALSAGPELIYEAIRRVMPETAESFASIMGSVSSAAGNQLPVVSPAIVGLDAQNNIAVGQANLALIPLSITDAQSNAAIKRAYQRIFPDIDLTAVGDFRKARKDAIESAISQNIQKQSKNPAQVNKELAQLTVAEIIPAAEQATPDTRTLPSPRSSAVTAQPVQRAVPPKVKATPPPLPQQVKRQGPPALPPATPRATANNYVTQLLKQQTTQYASLALFNQSATNAERKALRDAINRFAVHIQERQPLVAKELHSIWKSITPRSEMRSDSSNINQLNEDRLLEMNAARSQGFAIAAYELGREFETYLSVGQYSESDERRHKTAVRERLYEKYAGKVDDERMEEALSVVDNSMIYLTASRVTGIETVVIVPKLEDIDYLFEKDEDISLVADGIEDMDIEIDAFSGFGVVVMHPLNGMKHFGSREFRAIEEHEVAHKDFDIESRYMSPKENAYISELYAQLSDLAYQMPATKAARSKALSDLLLSVDTALSSEAYARQYGALSEEQFKDLTFVLVAVVTLFTQSLNEDLSNQPDILNKIRKLLLQANTLSRLASGLRGFLQTRFERAGRSDGMENIEGLIRTLDKTEHRQQRYQRAFEAVLSRQPISVVREILRRLEQNIAGSEDVQVLTDRKYFEVDKDRILDQGPVLDENLLGTAVVESLAVPEEFPIVKEFDGRKKIDEMLAALFDGQKELEEVLAALKQTPDRENVEALMQVMETLNSKKIADSLNLNIYTPRLPIRFWNFLLSLFRTFQRDDLPQMEPEVSSVDAVQKMFDAEGEEDQEEIQGRLNSTLTKNTSVYERLSERDRQKFNQILANGDDFITKILDVLITLRSSLRGPLGWLLDRLIASVRRLDLFLGEKFNKPVAVGEYMYSRTIMFRLENPIEIDGRVYRAVKVKGARIPAKGKIVDFTHAGDRQPATSFSMRQIGTDFVPVMVPVHVPYKTIKSNGARVEYYANMDALRKGQNVNLSLAYGVSERQFEYPNAQGDPQVTNVGYVASLITDKNDERFYITVGNYVLPLFEASKKGRLSESEKENLKVWLHTQFENYGKALREFNEHYYHPDPHSGNVNLEGDQFNFHDTNSVKKLDKLSQQERVGYLLNGLYSFLNAIHEFETLKSPQGITQALYGRESIQKEVTEFLKAEGVDLLGSALKGYFQNNEGDPRISLIKDSQQIDDLFLKAGNPIDQSHPIVQLLIDEIPILRSEMRSAARESDENSMVEQLALSGNLWQRTDGKFIKLKPGRNEFYGARLISGFDVYVTDAQGEREELAAYFSYNSKNGELFLLNLNAEDSSGESQGLALEIFNLLAHDTAARGLSLSVKNVLNPKMFSLLSKVAENIELRVSFKDISGWAGQTEKPLAYIPRILGNQSSQILDVRDKLGTFVQSVELKREADGSYTLSQDRFSENSEDSFSIIMTEDGYLKIERDKPLDFDRYQGESVTYSVPLEDENDLFPYLSDQLLVHPYFGNQRYLLGVSMGSFGFSGQTFSLIKQGDNFLFSNQRGETGETLDLDLSDVGSYGTYQLSVNEQGRIDIESLNGSPLPPLSYYSNGGYLYSYRAAPKPLEIRGVQSTEEAEALNQFLYLLHQRYLLNGDLTDTSLRYQEILASVPVNQFIRNELGLEDAEVALVPIGSTLKGYAVNGADLREGDTPSDIEYFVLVTQGSTETVSRLLSQSNKQAIVDFVNAFIESQDDLNIKPEPRRATERFGDLTWLNEESLDDNVLGQNWKTITYLFMPMSPVDSTNLEQLRTKAVSHYNSSPRGQALWRNEITGFYESAFSVAPSVLQKQHAYRWVKEHPLTAARSVEEFLILENEDLGDQTYGRVQGPRIRKFNQLRLADYALPGLDVLTEELEKGRSEMRSLEESMIDQIVIPSIIRGYEAGELDNALLELTRYLPELQSLENLDKETLEQGLRKTAENTVKSIVETQRFSMLTEEGSKMDVYDSPGLPGLIAKVAKDYVDFDTQLSKGYNVAKNNLGDLFAVMILTDVTLNIDGEEVFFENLIIQERVKVVGDLLEEYDQAMDEAPTAEERDRLDGEKEKLEDQLIALLEDMMKRSIIDSDQINVLRNYGLTATGRMIGFDFDNMTFDSTVLPRREEVEDRIDIERVDRKLNQVFIRENYEMLSYSSWGVKEEKAQRVPDIFQSEIAGAQKRFLNQYFNNALRSERRIEDSLFYQHFAAENPNGVYVITGDALTPDGEKVTAEFEAALREALAKRQTFIWDIASLMPAGESFKTEGEDAVEHNNALRRQLQRKIEIIANFISPIANENTFYNLERGAGFPMTGYMLREMTKNGVYHGNGLDVNLLTAFKFGYEMKSNPDSEELVTIEVFDQASDLSPDRFPADTDAMSGEGRFNWQIAQYTDFELTVKDTDAKIAVESVVDTDELKINKVRVNRRANAQREVKKKRSEQRIEETPFARYFADNNPNGTRIVSADDFDDKGQVTQEAAAEIVSAALRGATIILEPGLFTGFATKVLTADRAANGYLLEDIHEQLRKFGVSLQNEVLKIEGAFPEKGYMQIGSGFVLKEMLKNAFYHGNGLNLRLPAAFEFKFKDGGLTELHVYDQALGHGGRDAFFYDANSPELSGLHEFKTVLPQETYYDIESEDNDARTIKVETVHESTELKINRVIAKRRADAPGRSEFRTQDDSPSEVNRTVVTAWIEEWNDLKADPENSVWIDFENVDHPENALEKFIYSKSKLAREDESERANVHELFLYLLLDDDYLVRRTVVIEMLEGIDIDVSMLIDHVENPAQSMTFALRNPVVGPKVTGDFNLNKALANKRRSLLGFMISLLDGVNAERRKEIVPGYKDNFAHALRRKISLDLLDFDMTIQRAAFNAPWYRKILGGFSIFDLENKRAAELASQSPEYLGTESEIMFFEAFAAEYLRLFFHIKMINEGRKARGEALQKIPYDWMFSIMHNRMEEIGGSSLERRLLSWVSQMRSELRTTPEEFFERSQLFNTEIKSAPGLLIDLQAPDQSFFENNTYPLMYQRPLMFYSFPEQKELIDIANERLAELVGSKAVVRIDIRDTHTLMRVAGDIKSSAKKLPEEWDRSVSSVLTKNLTGKLTDLDIRLAETKIAEYLQNIASRPNQLPRRAEEIVFQSPEIQSLLKVFPDLTLDVTATEEGRLGVYIIPLQRPRTSYERFISPGDFIAMFQNYLLESFQFTLQDSSLTSADIEDPAITSYVWNEDSKRVTRQISAMVKGKKQTLWVTLHENFPDYRSIPFMSERLHYEANLNNAAYEAGVGVARAKVIDRLDDQSMLIRSPALGKELKASLEKEHLRNEPLMELFGEAFARMHQAGLTHRDLFLAGIAWRHVYFVASREGANRIAFLDFDQGRQNSDAEDIEAERSIAEHHLNPALYENEHLEKILGLSTQELTDTWNWFKAGYRRVFPDAFRSEMRTQDEKPRVEQRNAADQYRAVSNLLLPGNVPASLKNQLTKKSLDASDAAFVMAEILGVGIDQAFESIRDAARQQIAQLSVTGNQSNRADNQTLEVIHDNYTDLRAGLDKIRAAYKQGSFGVQKIPYIIETPAVGDIQMIASLLVESLKGQKSWLSDSPYLNVTESSPLAGQIFDILRNNGKQPRYDADFKAVLKVELGLDNPEIAALTLNQAGFAKALPKGIIGITHGGEQVKFEDLSYEEQLALMEVKLFELWALSLNTTAEALLLQYDPNLLRFFQIDRSSNQIVLSLDRFSAEMRTVRAVASSA